MTTKTALPHHPFLLAIVAATIAAAGCSRSDRPALGAVSGRVTLDGRPLPAAAVCFTPEGKGRTSLAATDGDGCYQLVYLRDILGANLGRHDVRITTATEENGGREMLPPQYHAQTVLEATVTAGDNRHDFALESRPITAGSR